MKFDRKVTVVNGKTVSRSETSNSVTSANGPRTVSVSRGDAFGPKFGNVAWQDHVSNAQLEAAVTRHTDSGSGASRVTSDYGGGYSPMGDGGFTNTQQTGYFGANAFTKTFDGILPEATEDTLVPYYRDIYYFDAIGGSACDMLSTFPYSDWQLSGVDTSRAPIYEDALARLGMRTLINEITLHYLVEGDFIGTLSYDPESRNFHDIFVHDRAYCRVIPAPFYSMQSMIQASANGRLNQFMNTPHRYREMLLKSYPRQLLQKLSSGLHDLNPLLTLHISRRTLADRLSGSSSYLRRLLPVYLLEKALYRGTLIEANRRQRSTAHITMGDEDWTPSPEEIADTVAAFKTTELDPLGAFIGTRNGVTVTDIFPAGEGYKWQDVTESLTPIKLRSLSISEAFLAGDACLAGDTMITTESGLRRIDDLGGTDDRIIGKWYPIDTVVDSRYGKGRAIAWMYNGNRDAYRVTTRDGHFVDATDNHRFLVQRHSDLSGCECDDYEWVRTDELSTGDWLVVRENWEFVKLDPVVSVEHVGKRDVFDLSMEEGTEPAFVANSIVVHNSFATAESAVATFMQNTSALRSYITYRTFTTKLFPLIALANGFYKPDAKIQDIKNPSDILFDMTNHKSLDIPKLIWTKDLSGGDPSARLDLLDRMADKGFPIALRTIAAAAGQDVGMLLNDLKEDQALRNALRKLAPTAMEDAYEAQAGANSAGAEGGDVGGEHDVWASVNKRTKARATRQISSGLGRIGMHNRIQAGAGDPEVHVLSRTGKRKAVANEQRHMRKQNEALVKAVTALTDKEVRVATLKRVAARYGGRIPNILGSVLSTRKG